MPSSMPNSMAQHAFLVNFRRADFDHVDAVLVAGENHVQIGVLQLGDGGVEDISQAVIGDDAADADGGGRSFERRVGDRQRGGCGGAGEHVGVVLAIVRHDPYLDLDLVDEAIGEERTDRAVDHPHREDLFLVWRALALAEAAWELARRGGLLAVVDGEREEVEALARLGADDGRQDGAPGVVGHDGGVAQFGDFAGLEDEVRPAISRSDSDVLHETASGSWPGVRARAARRSGVGRVRRA